MPGVEDLAVALRKIMGDHGLPNRGHILRLFELELIKETFDDVPDSGSGRTTVFLFPSEVEEEMKQAGQLPAADGKAPASGSAPGPLSGFEEVEEPGG